MRNYLVEDLEQIKRYFPGATPLAIETPFDLTDTPVTRAVTMPESDDYVAVDWRAQWIV